jgi:hypothetical protein
MIPMHTTSWRKEEKEKSEKCVGVGVHLVAWANDEDDKGVWDIYKGIPNFDCVSHHWANESTQGTHTSGQLLCGSKRHHTHRDDERAYIDLYRQIHKYSIATTTILWSGFIDIIMYLFWYSKRCLILQIENLFEWCASNFILNVNWPNSATTTNKKGGNARHSVCNKTDKWKQSATRKSLTSSYIIVYINL